MLATCVLCVWRALLIGVGGGKGEGSPAFRSNLDPPLPLENEHPHHPHQVIAERIMDLGTDRVPPLLLLPLFSNLSSDQQSKAFEAAEKAVRKCVVSTNIAETSVTVRCVSVCVLCAWVGRWRSSIHVHTRSQTHRIAQRNPTHQQQK